MVDLSKLTQSIEVKVAGDDHTAENWVSAHPQVIVIVAVVIAVIATVLIVF